jgi:hypothetical protein
VTAALLHITGIVGAGVAIVAVFLQTRHTCAVHAPIPLGAGIVVIARGLVIDVETSLQRVAGFVCTGIAIVTVLLRDRNALSCCTPRLRGADVAIFAEVSCVAGLDQAALSLLITCVHRAWVAVVADALRDRVDVDGAHRAHAPKHAIAEEIIIELHAIRVGRASTALDQFAHALP